MKRLLLLSVLLLPASIYALGEMARQHDAPSGPQPFATVAFPPAPPAPPPPVAPVAIVMDGAETAAMAPSGSDARDGEEPGCEDSSDEVAAIPPWTRPPGEDPASRQFREGRPRSVRLVIREKQRQLHKFGRSLIAPLDPSDVRSVTGEPMTTPERAIENAYQHLARAASRWAAPEVPATWRIPESLVRPMARPDPEIKEVRKDYADGGKVYRATLTCDFTPTRRAEIVRAYESRVVMHRLGILGVVLGFVMACLAAMAGYIRADEATRGYYTNRLRLMTAATLGAAGVVAYRLLA